MRNAYCEYLSSAKHRVDLEICVPTSGSFTAIAAVVSFEHIISISSAPAVVPQQHYNTAFTCCLADFRLKTPCKCKTKQVRVFFVPIAESDTDPSARKLLASTEAFGFGVCGGLLSGLPGASDNALLPCPTNYGCRRNSPNYWQCFPGATVVQPFVAPSSPPPPPPPSPPPMSPSPPSPSPPPATPLPSPVANHTTTGELAPRLMFCLEHHGQPGVLGTNQPVS